MYGLEKELPDTTQYVWRRGADLPAGETSTWRRHLVDEKVQIFRLKISVPDVGVLLEKRKRSKTRVPYSVVRRIVYGEAEWRAAGAVSSRRLADRRQGLLPGTSPNDTGHADHCNQRLYTHSPGSEPCMFLTRGLGCRRGASPRIILIIWFHNFLLSLYKLLIRQPFVRERLVFL